LPPLVTVSVQPVGELMLEGAAERNPAPGNQRNQKVPMVVVPVLLRVMEYS
jgi:hypothetical protein